MGRILNLWTPHDTEIDHRLKRAWSKFAMFKAQLTNKLYPLFERLRLFHAVVTPTILYGCASWVMTSVRERKLRTVQRKMLRLILGKSRITIDPNTDSSTQSADTESTTSGDAAESWVDWIRRVTQEALMAMSKVGVPDWAEEQQRRKFRWCGHVCRRHDERWAIVVLKCEPKRGHRHQGHPFSRWRDDLDAFF